MLTPAPTLTATPPLEPTGNLTIVQPSGWDGAIVAADSPGTQVGGEPVVGEPVYISWAITNTGPHTQNDLFYVDLLFDGMVLERWARRGVSPDRIYVVEDWEGLEALTSPHSGDHTLKLVVDSTGLIAETDESDNEIELELTWSPDLKATSTEPVPTKLPDFTPSASDSWSAPLIATSYIGGTEDGPLSVDVTSYLGFSVLNQGLASSGEGVWAHLYLDDVLVYKTLSGGLLADAGATLADWSDLFDVVPVNPGQHRLRLVLDPFDLVAESDEGNNSFEKTLTWGVGPVPPRAFASPTPAATPPPALALPNLEPAWQFGWDSPIVLSQKQDTFVSGALTAEEQAYLDVSVLNRSLVTSTQPFSIDLYLDGEKVHSFQVRGETEPSTVRFFEDWDGLDAPSVGEHTLRMVIDPEDAVQEADETDNAYEATFSWLATSTEPTEPIVYSDENLSLMLSDLSALLGTRDVALGPDGRDYTDDVIRVADAGYYLLTGTSLLDERVTVRLLSRQEYLDWIDDEFNDRFAIAQASNRDALLARRETVKSRASGFKTRRFGRVYVVVDADQRVPEVIDSLAHEMGHMRQDFLNPTQTEADGLYSVNGVQEAEAQQFQRAFWLRIEEFLGIPLLSYPDFDGFRASVTDGLDSWLTTVDEDEHSLGHLLQWAAVLGDPELADLKDQAVSGGGLDSAGSLRLYEYLVSMLPSVVPEYVAARIAGIVDLVHDVQALAWARLKSDLSPDDEGASALRVAGLLMP